MIRQESERGIRSVYWRALRWLSLEHLHLDDGGPAIRADGLIVGQYENAPIRLRYGIVCDEQWNTRSLDVEELSPDGRRVALERDEASGWRDSGGTSVPELGAAIDVDIAATPFTNTLPIRRLELQPGRSRELQVVYVNPFPTLSISSARQRYTCLHRDASGGRYRYESLESDFTADLSVDPDGLVIDYPGLWERVQP